MKKFFVILLILLILGGMVFYFGWVQFSVPPGSYGVLRSKTHGMDPRVIREGEFRWCWYKLIPNNAEILVFTPKPVSHNLSSSGSLPSGNVYAAIAGIQADFSWSVSGEFSFSVKPESIPELIQRERISSQNDLNALEDAYCRGIETLILNRLNILAQDEAKMEKLILSGSPPELNAEIETAFPELEKINCVVRTIRYPDYGLYKSARSLYNEYLATQQSVLQKNVERNAENNMEGKLKLDELEKIGEVLTRYPVLLQYLALEKGHSSILSAGE